MESSFYVYNQEEKQQLSLKTSELRQYNLQKIYHYHLFDVNHNIYGDVQYLSMIYCDYSILQLIHDEKT